MRGIGDQARKFRSQLSRGKQQRAAIAGRSPTIRPVLVTDEPTGNLDSAKAPSDLRALPAARQRRCSSNGPRAPR